MTFLPTSMPPNDDKPQRERLLALMADQALDRLSAEEEAELAGLRPIDPQADPLEFERAAAVAHLAFVEHSAQALPQDVRARSFANAAKWSKGKVKSGSSAVARVTSKSARPVTYADYERSERPSVIGRLGWLAAAACLALAVWGWLPRLMPQPTLADQRMALMTAPDKILLPLTPGGDESGESAQADIVWSTARQEGYLRVRGLVANTPSKWQYQLWIKAPNQQHPISAGVFDVVRASGDTIIPMNANLPVTQKPELFAVTVEDPGGVMVSDLQRVALMASPTR